MIEMHYGTGGHGGPYPNLFRAVRRALKLAGPSTGWIELRCGVSGPLVAVVEYHDNGEAYARRPEAWEQ